jgi:hypothetical protein
MPVKRPSGPMSQWTKLAIRTVSEFCDVVAEDGFAHGRDDDSRRTAR